MPSTDFTDFFFMLFMFFMVRKSRLKAED